MKKKLKLRGYVIPSICVMLLSLMMYSGYKVYKIINEEANTVVDSPVIRPITKDKVIPTITVNNAIIKPFDDESVSIKIPYYNMNDNDDNQQASLIYYENIYMQNTGIMYTSKNKFNVLSVLDGKVKSVKDDSIMGKIVEIEHNANTITIYQSLDNVNVSVNQQVVQGQIIGEASANSIVESDLYALHFEVYRNGELINPESFYKLSIEELNE